MSKEKDLLSAALEDYGLAADLEAGAGLQTVDPRSIPEAEPFRSLFTKDLSVLESIVQSMREGGFDASHPVLIWRNRPEGPALIDGYTRKAAAITAGVHQVPIVNKDFPTEKDAVDYAFAQQFRRRNLTEAEKLTLLLQWGAALESGVYGNVAINSPGRPKKPLTRQFVGKLLNVSDGLAGEFLAVLGAPDSIRDAVLSGELSVHQAATRARADAPKRRIGQPEAESKGVTKKTKEFGLSWSPEFSLTRSGENLIAVNPALVARLPEKDRVRLMKNIERLIGNVLSTEKQEER